MKINFKFVDKYKVFCNENKLYDKLLYNFFYYVHKEMVDSSLYDRCLALNEYSVKIEIPDKLFNLGFESLYYDVVLHKYELYYKNALLGEPYTKLVNCFKDLLQGQKLTSADSNEDKFSYILVHRDTERIVKLYYETYRLLGEFDLNGKTTYNTEVLTSNYYMVINNSKKIADNFEYLATYKNYLFYIMENRKGISELFSIPYARLSYYGFTILCYISKQDKYKDLLDMFDYLEKHGLPSGVGVIMDVSNWSNTKLALAIKNKINFISKKHKKLWFRF